MRTFFNLAGSIFVIQIFALVIAGISTSPARAGEIFTGCGIQVTKLTDTPTDQLFDFTAEITGQPSEDYSIGSETFFSVNINFGQQVIISEDVPDGWRLQDVSCDQILGAINVFVGDGNQLVVSCVEGGIADCVFYNVKTTKPIPTLSEWGMISAAAGLVMIGLFFAVRRRKARAV